MQHGGLGGDLGVNSALDMIGKTVCDKCVGSRTWKCGDRLSSADGVCRGNAPAVCALQRCRHGGALGSNAWAQALRRCAAPLAVSVLLA